MPLPSASILVNMLNTFTGFTYRGLTPHEFTPMPGVHKVIQLTRLRAQLILVLGTCDRKYKKSDIEHQKLRKRFEQMKKWMK
jgi:hypothetical protein